jgi:hypothetical protein
MSNVHLPLFQSKFLLACSDYLIREHHLNDIVPFAKLRSELFCVGWDSGLSGGFPCFHSDDGGWSFEGRNDDSGVLMMDVFDRGAVRFRSLDGESEYLNTRIEAPDELGEIMALFTSIKPTHLSAPHWTSLLLSSIVEKVFLVLPRDGRDFLVPFDANHLAAQQPELWKAIKVLHNLKTDWEALNTLEYSCWAEWVTKHADWNALPELTKPTSRDLFYSEDCGLHSWRLHAERTTELFDTAPKLALRISARHSPMFFHLFTQQTREGAPLLTDLIANLENLQSWMKGTQVNYPSSIFAQRRLAFEFRVLRQEYDDKHASLVREHEPVKQLLELYNKRVRLIGLLHSEYVEEIEAAQRPLPFFIEYPLYRWLKTDDHDRMERVVRAKQLLTILVKSIVLLPLEEALAHTACPGPIHALAADLQRKPLSDGSWVELLGVLRKRFTEAAMSLPLFGDLLLESSKIETHLAPLVVARNRFNHPPYDANGLVTAFEQKLPEVIGFLRDHFSSRQFLMPKCMCFVGSRKLVRALLLTGRDTEFSIVEREVKGPLEAFPAGKIVATNSTGAQTLVLDRFFTGKSLKTETIDVGIFDRVEGDHACFEFVRGLGNDSEFEYGHVL